MEISVVLVVVVASGGVEFLHSPVICPTLAKAFLILWVTVCTHVYQDTLLFSWLYQPNVSIFLLSCTNLGLEKLNLSSGPLYHIEFDSQYHWKLCWLYCLQQPIFQYFRLDLRMHQKMIHFIFKLHSFEEVDTASWVFNTFSVSDL